VQPLDFELTEVSVLNENRIYRYSNQIDPTICMCTIHVDKMPD
jgi:hypothetical protein